MNAFSPYYAVIFTTLRTRGDHGYAKMAQKMEALARKQPGFLGFETARNEVGISISYWESLEDISRWKQNAQHLEAQRLGREKWYKEYSLKICKVEREYGYKKGEQG